MRVEQPSHRSVRQDKSEYNSVPSTGKLPLGTATSIPRHLNGQTQPRWLLVRMRERLDAAFRGWTSIAVQITWRDRICDLAPPKSAPLHQDLDQRSAIPLREGPAGGKGLYQSYNNTAPVRERAHKAWRPHFA